MPKRVDAVAQRQAIATAAVAVIDKSGLEGARLRDVAKAANVTTGAVTHYFDGKDAVLVAALEEVVRLTLARMDKPPPARSTVSKPGARSARTADPVDDRIATFVGHVCRYLPLDDRSRRQWRVWLAFWGRAIADDRLRKIHEAYYREIVERLAALLSTLDTPEHAPAPRTRRATADALVAAIDGVGTRATLEPDAWPAKRQRETLTRLATPFITAFVSADASPRRTSRTKTEP